MCRSVHPVGKLKDAKKRPFGDAASRNALNRFGSILQKKYAVELEGFDEETFRGEEREEVSALFCFIDEM